MSSRKQAVLTSLALAVSVGLTVLGVKRNEPMIWEFDLTVVESPDEPAVFEVLAEFQPETGIAHAPAIEVTRDGFSVLWFAGSKEAKPDVEIVTARFSRSGYGVFEASSPTTLLQAQQLTNASTPAQEVIVLGNTIAKPGTDAGYYSTILSLGGWATSGVMDVTMLEGEIQTAKRLELGPILGRSNLVREPALRFSDGDTALPAYFEMGNAFSQLVRIGSDGRVRDIRRISDRRYAIQPSIVALSPRNAVALMRGFDGGGHAYGSWTTDGGQTWSTPERLELPAPDAPVAALVLSDGRLLVAHNNDPERTTRMDLSISHDQGQSWQHLITLKDTGDAPETKMRYPALARLHTGEIVLAYSYGSKRGIRVQMFNETWLNAQ